MVVDGSSSSDASQVDVPWILDYRVTHHLTSDAYNIIDQTNTFLGHESITVGNG